MDELCALPSDFGFPHRSAAQAHTSPESGVVPGLNFSPSPRHARSPASSHVVPREFPGGPLSLRPSKLGVEPVHRLRDSLGHDRLDSVGSLLDCDGQ